MAVILLVPVQGKWNINCAISTNIKIGKEVAILPLEAK